VKRSDLPTDSCRAGREPPAAQSHADCRMGSRSRFRRPLPTPGCR
jgi:hypothetical protein